jgi:hypothetical protein
MNRRDILRSVVAAGASGLVAEGAAGRSGERSRTTTVEKSFRAVPFREGADQPWNGQGQTPHIEDEAKNRPKGPWEAWAKRLPERNLDVHDAKDEEGNTIRRVMPPRLNKYGWMTDEDPADRNPEWVGRWQPITDESYDFTYELDMGPMARKDQLSGLDAPGYTTELNFDLQATVKVRAECTRTVKECGGGTVDEPGEITAPSGETPTIRFEGETTVTLTDGDAYQVFYEGSDASYNIDAGGAEWATDGETGVVLLTPSSIAENEPTDWEQGTVRIRGDGEAMGLNGGANLVVETSSATYTVESVGMTIDEGSLGGDPVRMVTTKHGDVTTTGDGGGGETVELFKTKLGGFLPSFPTFTVFEEEKVTNDCSKKGKSFNEQLPGPPYSIFTLSVNGQPVGTWDADRLYFARSREPPYFSKTSAAEVKKFIRSSLDGVNNCEGPLAAVERYLSNFERVVFEIQPPANEGFSWLQAETPPDVMQDGKNTMEIVGLSDLRRPLLRLHDTFVELAAPPFVGVHGWTPQWNPSVPKQPFSMGPLKRHVENQLRRDLGQYPWLWAHRDLEEGDWWRVDDESGAHPFVFYGYDNKGDVDEAAKGLSNAISFSSDQRMDNTLGVLGSYDGEVWAHGQSMGGLVWRTALKRHGLDAEVENLTMTGTPNLGSALADAYVYGRDFGQVYWESRTDDEFGVDFDDAYKTPDGFDPEPTEGIIKYRYDGKPWWETGVVGRVPERDHLADFQLKPEPHNGFLRNIETRKLALPRENYFTVIGNVSRVSSEEASTATMAAKYMKVGGKSLDQRTLDDGATAAKSLSIDELLRQREVGGFHTEVPAMRKTAKWIARFHADLKLDSGVPTSVGNEAHAAGAAGGSRGAWNDEGDDGPDAASSADAGLPRPDAPLVGTDSGRAADAFDPAVTVDHEVAETRPTGFGVVSGEDEDRFRFELRAPDGSVLSLDTDRDGVEVGRTDAMVGRLTFVGVDEPATGTWTVGLSVRADASVPEDEPIRLLAGVPLSRLLTAPMQVEVPGGVVARPAPPDATATPTGATATGETGTATETSTPGFGLGLGAASVAGGAVLRALRLRRDE